MLLPPPETMVLTSVPVRAEFFPIHSRRESGKISFWHPNTSHRETRSPCNWPDIVPQSIYTLSFTAWNRVALNDFIPWLGSFSRAYSILNTMLIACSIRLAYLASRSPLPFQSFQIWRSSSYQQETDSKFIPRPVYSIQFGFEFAGNETRLPPCCPVILIKVLQQAMNENMHCPFAGENSNDIAIGGAGMSWPHLSVYIEQIENGTVCTNRIQRCLNVWISDMFCGPKNHR